MALLVVWSFAGCGEPSPLVDAGDAAAPDAASDGGPSAACSADSSCDDGVFCNGAERCDPSAPDADAEGCVVASSGPCDASQTCDEGGSLCVDPDCEFPDADGDGVRSIACGGADCDDADANRYPGNTEICDVAEHDEDCDPLTYGFRDSDGDAHPDALCCNVSESGVRSCGDDCDDMRPDRYPGLVEACDGFDNDCDEQLDEGVLMTFYPDVDGDGFGDAGGVTMQACFRPTGHSAMDGDCDDAVAAINPARPEQCDAAMVDDDCDGMRNEMCSCTGAETRACMTAVGACAAGTEMCSGGTFGSCSIAPQTESCNGIDDDCDGSTDEGGLLIECYDDTDNDGYAASGAPASMLCPVGGRPSVGGCPTGYTNRRPEGALLDCAGTDSSRNPAAVEICDAVDQDCDGAVDEGRPTVTRYIDRDGDGFAGEPVARCEGDPNSQSNDEDCDEDSTSTYLGAPEACNRVDNDCSDGGGVDVDEDFDDDGHAPIGAACTGGLARDDCDDTIATINPDESETCNGADDDCNGTVDDETPTDLLCDSGVAAGTGICLDGACVLASCDFGFADCDADARFVETTAGNLGGCEANLRTSSEHCGACGVSCAGECVDGVCAAVAVAAQAGLGSAGLLTDSGQRYGWGAYIHSGLNAAAAPGEPTAQLAPGLPGPVDEIDGSGCARAGGEVYCWGQNGTGQVGSGRTGPNVATAEQVQGISDAISIVRGSRHACAVRAGGGVSCWGSNSFGQLGDGEVDHGSDCFGDDCSRTPVTVLDVTTATDVSAGYTFTCAILGDESVICWGQDGPVTGDRVTEVAPGRFVVPLPAAQQIRSGDSHTCARTSGDDVYCWGNNAQGSLGNGTVGGSSATPQLALSAVVDVDAYRDSSCAVLAIGEVWCWGDNQYGQLGDGTTTDTASPVRVVGIDDAVEVRLGQRHACALRANGSIACWGAENSGGQLGTGGFEAHLEPRLVHHVNMPFDVLLGGASLVGRRQTAQTAQWGRIEHLGGLFDGTPYIDASLGQDHGCATLTNRTVRCAGRGDDGQLGDGRNMDELGSGYGVPLGLDRVVELSAGFDKTCAVRDDSSAWCWGFRAGPGLVTETTPALMPYTDVAQVSVGTGSCVRTHDGRVECWNMSSPTVGRGFRDVAAGDQHGYAIAHDGNLLCWGDNTYGQLGRGTVGGSGSAAEVPGLAGVVDVALSSDHSCALRADGEIYCWGNNDYGMFGVGDGNPRSSPVRFPTGSSRAVRLSVGRRNVCALLDTGRVLCTGDNYYGQLSDLPDSSYPDPVQLPWW